MVKSMLPHRGRYSNMLDAKAEPIHARLRDSRLPALLSAGKSLVSAGKLPVSAGIPVAGCQMRERLRRCGSELHPDGPGQG